MVARFVTNDGVFYFSTLVQVKAHVQGYLAHKETPLPRTLP